MWLPRGICVVSINIAMTCGRLQGVGWEQRSHYISAKNFKLVECKRELSHARVFVIYLIDLLHVGWLCPRMVQSVHLWKEAYNSLQGSSISLNAWIRITYRLRPTRERTIIHIGGTIEVIFLIWYWDLLQWPQINAMGYILSESKHKYISGTYTLREQVRCTILHGRFQPIFKYKNAN